MHQEAIQRVTGPVAQAAQAAASLVSAYNHTPFVDFYTTKLA